MGKSFIGNSRPRTVTPLQSAAAKGLPPKPAAHAVTLDRDGQPAVLWRERTLLKALDMSRTVLWQRIGAGAFPPPIKMPDDRGEPGKMNRWKVADVMAWIDAGMPHWKTLHESKGE